MALLSRKEFAEKCFVNTRALSVYIKRKEVVLSGDFIDTEVDDNRYFIEKRVQFQHKKDLKNGNLAQESLNERVVDQAKPEVQSQFEFPHESSAPISENFQLDSKIKKLSAEKTSLDIEILQAKRDKLMGELIPTILVKNLLLQHSKSITMAFKDGAETLLVKVSQMKALELGEMAELRKELIQIINLSVEKAIDESKSTISAIVAEYSQQREVGERS